MLLDGLEKPSEIGGGELRGGAPSKIDGLNRFSRKIRCPQSHLLDESGQIRRFIPHFRVGEKIAIEASLRTKRDMNVETCHFRKDLFISVRKGRDIRRIGHK